MSKRNKKLLSLSALLLIAVNSGYSQAKSGVESYNFLSHEAEYYWMPVVHYQSTKGVYAELRYNYEEKGTVSLYGGKTFSTGGSFSVDYTPLIGFSVGTFKGLSLAANTSMEYSDLFSSTQLQYSRSITGKMNSFFFMWSEVGYDIFPNFFAGLAVQLTCQAGETQWEPGFLGGVSIGNFSVPVYLFRPFQPGYSIVMGINYEYQLKKKNKQSKELQL